LISGWGWLIWTMDYAHQRPPGMPGSFQPYVKN